MIVATADSVTWTDPQVWIPLVVSLLAFGLSLAAFMVSFRRRKEDRLIAIYETMVEADRQHGRRILFRSFARNGKSLDHLWEKAGNDRDAVNNALGVFDVLGFYVSNGWVERESVLQLWTRQLLRIRPPAVEFLAQREADEPPLPNDQDRPLWPYFRDLMAEAHVEADMDLEEERRALAKLNLDAGSVPSDTELRSQWSREVRVQVVRLEIDRQVKRRAAEVRKIRKQRNSGDADLAPRPEDPDQVTAPG